MARFEVPPRPEHDPVPDLDARVIHDADGVLALDKPPGLPTTGRALDDSDCLQFWVIQRARKMVWAVHQLDADTTGVIVFVRKKSLVPVWQQRLRFPNGRKRYLALVHGSPDWDRRRVDAPIGSMHRRGRRSWGVRKGGRPAATRFQVEARGPGHALLSCTLETGRTHQIRVHLEHEGFSLVGEEWYRHKPCTEHPRQALHAMTIGFRDGAEPQSLTAPLPSDLRALAARLGVPVPPEFVAP